MHKFKVKFQPEGKTVHVSPGITLAAAAVEAGVSLDVPCGVLGKCGKCRVEVSEGANEPDYIEKEKLSEEEINRGVRLACRAKVFADAVVTVPRTSKLQTQKILEVGVQTQAYLNPCAVKYTLKGAGAELPGTLLAQIKEHYKAELKDLTVKYGGSATVTACSGELVSVEKGDTAKVLYGMAFDVGTTTVVGTLVDLKTGLVKATAADMNAQIVYGDDVISRLNFCITNKNGLQILNAKILGVLNKIIAEACEEAEVKPENIYDAVICGNTAMEHLLLKVDPASLAVYPFDTKLTSDLVKIRAVEFGININERAFVKVFPVIGGWVGGDTVGVVLAVEQHKSSKLRLSIDIGTNGEIVLGNKDSMLSASCAAGPAFEGAHIKHGMRASSGSIEKIDFDGKEIICKTIYNAPPRGFCGSGLIDAMALLVEEGIVDETGRIKDKSELREENKPETLVEKLIELENGNEFVFVETAGKNITLSQRDVREIQLAKGAMLAGIRILMKQLKVKVEDLHEVLIAGAFGNYIRAEKALSIGLIPAIDIKKIKFCGNAAEEGARKALVSQDFLKEAEEIAKKVRHIDLSADPGFQDEFAGAMMFEYKKSS
ncbi:MAG: ASKHA domain-containing protein [Candidatus Firestonebacteria bacterium]